MNKTQKIIIAALLVVAALLAAGISLRGRSGSSVAANLEAGSSAPAAAPAGSQASASSADAAKAAPASPAAPTKPAFALEIDKLTVAQKESRLMGMNLSAASSDSVKNEYFYIANALAKTAPVLEIAECVPTPLVYEISETPSFTVKNTGTKAVELNFGGAKNYSVAPGKSLLIKDALTHGVGFYGYGCTGKQGPAGIVYLSFLPQ